MGLRYRVQRAMTDLASMALTRSGVFSGFYAPWRSFFEMFQRRGIHALPVHYYSPVPDTRTLPERLWTARSSMAGVTIDRGAALALLRRMEAYRSEYGAWPTGPVDDPSVFTLANGTFRSGDAEVLYAMVRLHRPRRVIEIGSGNSTLVTAAAVRANQKDDPSCSCRFVAVEPYPAEFIRRGVPGLAGLIDKPVDQVPLAEFEALEENDILFIDSTHVAKIGSDVLYEFLEVLPRLRTGVLVHVHDIFLPAEYPRRFIHEHRFFWNEQYLLQAFLAFNSAFEVVWPGHLMHLEHPEELARAFPAYSAAEHQPGSFWMRRVG